MRLIEIKHWNGSTLHTIEADNIKSAIEALVKSGADLRGAFLDGAFLDGADLRGADYGDGIPLTKIPISIIGLNWPILILDNHLKIGCELHTFVEWENFADSEISQMHPDALDWWKIHKAPIMAMVKTVR